jgi:hypothetical protein
MESGLEVMRCMIADIVEEERSMIIERGAVRIVGIKASMLVVTMNGRKELRHRHWAEE